MADPRPPDPVIVVPGITASRLRDDYQIPAEIVWSALRKDYDRVTLHPDERRYEVIEPSRVRGDQILEIAYNDLVEELRHDLPENPMDTVPVFPYGYDWRQPLDVIEADFAEFVDEVIDRTKLIRAYDRAEYGKDPKVNLLGHSMGGLIIAGYLETNAANARVNKVATLATPFQGSYESVIQVTTGTANLGTSSANSREREAARMTPALYHLLPSFENALTIAPGLGDIQSLYQVDAWQPNIIETLERFIRVHGVQKPGISFIDRATTALREMLEAAGRHRVRVDNLNLADAGLKKDDWLCVVGVGSTTRVALELVAMDGKPDFRFNSSDRDDRWWTEKEKRSDDTEAAGAATRRLTGDGTVPFNGAVPKFLGLENLVCVSPDDYGYWELKDKALTKAAGFHGVMPTMNMLHRLVVRHFAGKDDPRGNTWGRRAPGVLSNAWKPPFKQLRDKDVT